MNKCFNKEVSRILKVAEEEMKICHHPYVGSEHLLLSLLKSKKIKEICDSYNLTYSNFKKELLKVVGSCHKESEYILYTPLLKIIINKASKKAKDDNQKLDELYLLTSLLEEQDGIALSIAGNMGVDIDSLLKDIKKPSLIYELGISLNNEKCDQTLLREKEINEIMSILLRKNKNNPILIGHAGVGKTAIISELANRIKNGKVPDKLKNNEIVLINTSTLIAGTKYRGEFESRVNNLISECIKCKNIILFIDEIHTLVKTGSSDGSIDAANILKPYLARGDIKVIGATTLEEYNEYIKRDMALSRRFTPVIVNEPSISDMNYILNHIKKSYEDYYNLKIDKNVISYLIDITSKYIPNSYNPDKSIEVLDSVCSKKVLDNYSNSKIDKNIIKEDVYNLIKDRVNITNINTMVLDEVYNTLKEKYNERTIKSIINIIKDNSFNKYMILNGDDKNKIKILKYIANKIKVNLIDIDCKEYNDEYSLNKLLNNNYLYNILEENPYSFIIFSNYEESNKVLYNLINTMIHSGYISNLKNEKVYLNNSIIFILNNKEESKVGFNFNNNVLIKA